MNQSTRHENAKEFIEIELQELEEQLADAWWNEQPLDRIECIERQIEERATMLSGSDLSDSNASAG